MRLPWRKTNSTAACWGRRVRPPCGLRVGVASDSEGSGTVRRTAWRDIFMMGDVVSDGVRGVPIATEKKQRSSREPMFRWLAEQPQAGAATWTTSSWARVWHARPGLLPHSGPICGLCGRGSERCDRAPSLAGDRMVMSSGLSYQDFGGAEVTAVESGRIEAALLVEPPVLFLLIRFRQQTDRVALGLVCSCCWWGSPEERTDPPASEVVRFVLVEGQSGIVPRSEHSASLWNSPGRFTVPLMSRHGLVTTLRTKSRLRRWFASTRPINCGIAARCDAAHKRARSNHESERVADPLRPREPRPERGPFPPRRPPAAVEFRCPPGVAAAIGLNLRAVHGRSLRGRPHNTPPDGSAAAAVLIRGSDPPGQGSSRLIGDQADHLPREVTPGAEGPLGAPTYRGIKHVQEPNQQEAGHPSTFRNRPE